MTVIRVVAGSRQNSISNANRMYKKELDADADRNRYGVNLTTFDYTLRGMLLFVFTLTYDLVIVFRHYVIFRLMILDVSMRLDSLGIFFSSVFPARRLWLRCTKKNSRSLETLLLPQAWIFSITENITAIVVIFAGAVMSETIGSEFKVWMILEEVNDPRWFRFTVLS